jgi:ABC-2 type transport system permease protein
MLSELRTFTTALKIARRDLLDLWRAKMLLFAFLLMPLLLMSMFGYMFPTTPKANPTVGNMPTAYPNLPLALVQVDQGSLANAVANQFVDISQAQQLFRVSEMGSYTTARDCIVRGTTSGIVVIPDGFTAAINAGMQATVQVTVDETNPQIAAVVQGEVAAVFGVISSSISTTAMRNTMGNNARPIFLLEPISIAQVPLISGTSTTFQFLAPGFMALTVVFGALSGVGFAISREREQGTMDGLLVSPITRRAVIFGKVLSQTVRGLIQAFLILGLSMLLFGVRIYGNPLLMLLTMLLGVASFVGVGIILTSFAPEQETAQMMVILLQFPMMFLSGIIFPVTSLPGWMQWIGKAMPLYYAADALRKVVILNAGLNVIGMDLMILVAYALVTLTAAVPVFERAMTR